VAFDTSVLDKALAQQRAIRERKRQAVLDRLLHLLDELGPRYGISEAYIFGSVTRPGRFDVRRMREEIPGVRPALLSHESYMLLNGLRGFRRFFRHAYGVPIEYAQLQINLEKARRLRPLLQQDVARFLQQLRGASE